MSRKLKKTAKIKLLHELYNTVFQQADSFEKRHIGSDLAYLMGAIVTDSWCMWDTKRSIVKIIKDSFKKDDKIWEYIKIVEGQHEKESDG